MALFGFGKKNEEAKENTSCCCGGDECGIRSIKVLGPGCKNCHELHAASVAAVKELGMELEVEYITDMEKIMSYGVMSMPALVINEQVVSMGKALKTAELIRLLKNLGYC